MATPIIPPLPTAGLAGAPAPVNANVALIPSGIPWAPVPRSQVDKAPGAVKPGPTVVAPPPATPVPISAVDRMAAPVANLAAVQPGPGAPVPTATLPGGLQYSVQINGGNGTFFGTQDFQYDTVNRIVKVGNWYNAAFGTTTDLLASGNIIVGNIHSQTGAVPFGYAYAEFGRIRYLDDVGHVYGFSGRDQDDENWFCMVNEPGHEYNSATAMVLPLSSNANSNGTFFGISVNSTNPRGNRLNNINWSPIYSDPYIPGWQQLLRLTGQDLFLPQLSEAVGPKFLAYDPSTGRITYTTGSGGGGIAIQDEGINVVASTNVVNFVGLGVDGTNVSGVATIKIPGLVVKNQGANIVVGANTINFTGSGVTTTNVGGVATVTITGGIAGVTINDEGATVVPNANTINFVGPGITATNVAGVATVRVAANTLPGGANTQVQFNDNGVLAGSARLTFDKVAGNLFLVGNSFVNNGLTVSGVSRLNSVGNVIITGGTSGQVLTTNGNGNLRWTTVSGGNSYTLPIASSSTLGGIKIGTGLSIDGTGVVSATGASGITVRDEGTNVVVGATAINFIGSGVTAASVGGVPTITIPGGGNGAPAGNVGEVQFNGGGSFAANYNLKYNNGGLFVGGIGNPEANAQGIISAINEFRVGIWTYDGSLYGDKWGRMRMGQAGFRNIEYYGFIGDPSINPRTSIAPRTLVITNEELEVKQAMVLMDGLVYEASAGNTEGTIFGISGLNYPANTYQPTTGLEPGWAKLIDVTNKGNVKIGGSLVLTPGFQPTPPGNTAVGIRFADGTFQYTAAAGSSSLTIKEEGANVVTNTTTINFVGAGVTASNVGGVATVTVPGSGGDVVYNKGNVSGATTINLSDGTIQFCTLTGNTVFNISSATVGKSLTLILTQGTGGNKFATYGNTVYWAAGYKTLSTTAGAIDMVNLVNLGVAFAATLTTGYAV